MSSVTVGSHHHQHHHLTSVSFYRFHLHLVPLLRLVPPPRAAVTKCHKAGGLKQQKFFLSLYSSGGWKSKFIFRAMLSLEALGGNLPHASFSASGVVSTPWHSLAC